MRTTCALAVAVATCVLGSSAGAAPPVAGRDLTLRLLVAGQDNATTDTAGLQDVLPTLRDSLRFASYRLVSTRTVSARPGAKADLGLDLSLTLTAVDGDIVTVDVLRGDRRLLQTKLRLLPDKPVILGGFPADGGGTHILVITVR